MSTLNPRHHHMMRTISAYYQRHAELPKSFKMHPAFLAGLRLEPLGAQSMFATGRPKFENIPIKQTPGVHAVECSKEELL